MIKRNTKHPRVMTAPEVNRAVGARIRERRLLLAMSLEQVAERLPVGFQTLQKYESGAVGVDMPNLVAIAATLNCTPFDLMVGLPPVRFTDVPLSPDAITVARAMDGIKSGGLRLIAKQFMLALQRHDSEHPV